MNPVFFVRYALPVWILLCVAGLTATAGDNRGATALQCEYLENPLGIDAAKPRFTWKLADSSPGARQTSFRIRVAEDSLSLDDAAQSVVWDSHRQNSPDRLISYDGVALKPFTRYYWTAQLWDKEGKKYPASAVAWFETGMMGSHNWKGSWISDDNGAGVKSAPYFRKGFSVEKQVRSARVYIAVGGLFELYMNGERIGDHSLDPVYTRFDRRTMYVTHDVTGHLQQGKNAIGVLLGNGWYNHQSTAVWNFHQAPWRNRPVFCADLRITYTDGTVETIHSDKSWKTSWGPLIFNSIYTAEHYDARKEIPGWNTAGFDDAAWKNAVNRATPSQLIVAQAMRPVRRTLEIKPVSFRQLNDSTWLYDLGRNIAGVSRIRVSGEAGTVLRLKHAERIGTTGYADMSNIDYHYRPTDDTDPFQTDIFILKGQGEEEFMPRFNYKGFQYVEVTASKPISLAKENLTGFFMHSDVPPVGRISSSSPTLDKIWWATNNAYLSNLFGYPTDCPQREKNGWTGDAHIAVETGLYNFDGITVYEKWLADHRDEQQPNGILPAIIPTGGWGYHWANGPDWTSTIAIIPWNIYLFYGDHTLLHECYDNIKRYVDAVERSSVNGLTSWGLGDWVPVKSKSPVELTSSIYFYVDALIMAKTAALFHQKDDERKYRALADKVRSAINDKYLDAETGLYGQGLQTELSMPLYWDIVPDSLRAKVAANLAKRVEADNFYLDVGLLGTKAILNALSENGYADVAYHVAARETYPSWGWWIVNGATTLYENWRIDAARDISLNHIMFGEIGAWYYKALGGIRPDEKAPGFQHVYISPQAVQGLERFSAEYDSPHGTIRSSWEQKGGRVTYRISIPASATATFRIPEETKRRLFSGKQVLNGFVHRLEAGEYVFELR